MNNSIKIISIALVISVSACSTIEEQAPMEKFSSNTEQSFESSIRVSNLTFVLDNSEGQGFNHPIDINRNGTVDFYFKAEAGRVSTGAERVTQDYDRLLSTVKLESAQQHNGTISLSTSTERICGKYMAFTPVKTLFTGAKIDANSNWATDPLFYVYVSTASDCTYHRQYVKSNRENVIGVKFTDDRVIYYGWITIKPQAPRFAAQGPAKWTVVEYGFNSNPGEGISVK